MNDRKLSGMKRVERNVQLFNTKNDNSFRYGTKTVPNKKKIVKKFDYRRDL